MYPYRCHKGPSRSNTTDESFYRGGYESRGGQEGENRYESGGGSEAIRVVESQNTDLTTIGRRAMHESVVVNLFTLDEPQLSLAVSS